LVELQRNTCVPCGHISTGAFEFCPKCGKQRMVDDGSLERADIRKFLAAFFIVTIYILSSGFFGVWEGYLAPMAFDVAFFFIVICTGYWYRDTLLPVIGLRQLKLSKIGLYCLMQVGLTAFVFLFSEVFQQLFETRTPDLIDDFADAPFPLAFAIVSTAVFPAITEELAFRGILFGQLRKLTSALSTVVVTGVLFALVHFSFISFIWLIPAGIFFGYMRSREENIGYGIICHFQHNLTVVLSYHFALQ